MKNFQITQWCARFIKEQVSPGDLCIDATMGNGNDTLLLSTLCGKDGRVIAFDIQEQAVKSTKERLSKADAPDNYTLLLESHTQMSSYAKENSVSCITFNLGYLPGGDHTMATKSDSSIAALTQGLSLLKKGGLISLCIYSGGDSGFLRNGMQFLRGLQHLIRINTWSSEAIITTVPTIHPFLSLSSNCNPGSL